MNVVGTEIDFDSPCEQFEGDKANLYWHHLPVQRGNCYFCLRPEWEIGKTLQLHRYLPGKLGGAYTLNNTVLLCPKCHRMAEGLTELQLIDLWAFMDECQGVIQ